MSWNRRQWMKMSLAGGASLLPGSLGRVGRVHAAEADSGYKALVCVFLYGGNDGNNVLVPLSGGAYDRYRSVRRGLALDSGALLPVQTAVSKAAYGFHPRMPEIQNLFARGKAAAVVNLGTLMSPITKEQLRKGTAPLPVNLYSHFDQQREWQTATGDPTSLTGWGGRLLDQVQPLNQPDSFPSFVSVAGNTVLGSGVKTQAGAVSPYWGYSLAGFNPGYTGDRVRLDTLNHILGFDTGLKLLDMANGRLSQGIRNAQQFAEAMVSAPEIHTEFPQTGLGAQLKQVARLISAHRALGSNRQIFFCTQGIYDTHTDQFGLQGSLLADLSAAVGAFYDATVELDVAKNVALFTESEFGRTLQPNSNGGSDHAWGNHQLVVGGGVRGCEVYGQMPSFVLGGDDDTSAEGRWIPTLALDQYGATLARWFGLSPEAQTSVFPNLVNFARKDLGFMA